MSTTLAEPESFCLTQVEIERSVKSVAGRLYKTCGGFIERSEYYGWAGVGVSHALRRIKPDGLSKDEMIVFVKAKGFYCAIDEMRKAKVIFRCRSSTPPMQQAVLFLDVSPDGSLDSFRSDNRRRELCVTERAEVNDMLSKCFGAMKQHGLTDDWAFVVKSTYLNGMTNKEVAAALGTTVKRVQYMRGRAIHVLRNHFNDNGEADV